MRLTLHNIILAVLLPLCTHTAFAQSAPNLGTASSFAAFTANGAFIVTGATVVTGDVGSNIGAYSGFPIGSVLVGQSHVANSTSATAAADVNSAYTNLDGQAAGTVLTTLGGGQSLLPGTYTYACLISPQLIRPWFLPRITAVVLVSYFSPK